MLQVSKTSPWHGIIKVVPAFFYVAKKAFFIHHLLGSAIASEPSWTGDSLLKLEFQSHCG